MVAAGALLGPSFLGVRGNAQFNGRGKALQVFALRQAALQQSEAFQDVGHGVQGPRVAAVPRGQDIEEEKTLKGS